MNKNVKELSTQEVFKAVESGEVFYCPACKSKLETIPKEISAGEKVLGVACPVEQHHYLIYREDTDKVTEMRRRMKERAEAKEQKS